MFPLYDNNPHRRVPWFTVLIILINTGVMLWLSQMPEARANRIFARYGFVPARVAQLSNPQLVVKVDLSPAAPEGQQLKPAQKQIVNLPANPQAIYTSMLTMMFLHGGWLHLIGNMWFLWIFGNNIEDRLGHLIYLCFYLLGGFFALAVHYLTDAQGVIPVIGASGAVSAVLGAYAVTYPHAKVKTLIFLVFIITVVDLPALLVLGIYFVQQLLSGLNVLGMGADGGVAFWAHIGGFVAGMVLMPLLALGAPPPDKDWQAEVANQFGPSSDYR